MKTAKIEQTGDGQPSTQTVDLLHFHGFYVIHAEFPASDRSPIKTDRPQTIDHQDQSTSDRFLKPRPRSVALSICSPLITFHLTLITKPLISRGLAKFPAHPRKISESTFPSQILAITNLNHLSCSFTPSVRTNTFSLQKKHIEPLLR